jgi:dTDP-3-amino-3,4,6-trideoxy-alpha-D-glucose transaminase
MSEQTLPTLVAANDFVRQWESIREDAMDAVDRVGRSGWLILGEEVRSFERELANWWGIPHAVGVASGLDALEIALRCAGAGPGDRVLTTPLTAYATTLAIIRCGATPVWCDVDESGLIDLARASAALAADSSIRFVLPVHLYGHPIDPAGLRDLGARHGVRIVEDCAQSVGAERAGAPTGAVGIAAGTSLYPTKNLGALGDGGVLLTCDPAVAERARVLRDYGQRARYEHVEFGLNSRLDELHAAILRSALLPRLAAWLARRRSIAARYIEGLEPVSSSLRPIVPAAGASASHLFPVAVCGADPVAVAAALRDAGIGVNRHYPVLCSDQAASRGVGIAVDPLLTARHIAAAELSLPIHPHLTDDEVERVIQACGTVAS